LKIRTDRPAVGADVYAVGSAGGQTQVATAEKVTAIRQTSITQLQTTARIDNGSSGGPLIDSRGQVVGVMTSAEATDRSYAIDAADVIDLLKHTGPAQPLEGYPIIKF
jgi:S1-C subfamily serine protease